jgi:hypothetical protein
MVRKNSFQHEGTKNTRGSEIVFSELGDLRASLENEGLRGLGQFKEPPDRVIPAWSAGIQVAKDVSGNILANLDAGYPCRHHEDLRFHVLASVK